jgi:hypothetical protein
MPIDPFTQQGAFGPEATAAMGHAFDAACEELRCTRWGNGPGPAILVN